MSGKPNSTRRTRPESRGTKKSAGADEKPSVAAQLVDLARRRYQFGRDLQGKAFAVDPNGPNVALPLSATGRCAFSSDLSAQFFDREGIVPGGSALSDALRVLIAHANRQEGVQVWMRYGRAEDGSIVVDVGDVEGRAIVVTSRGWTIVARSPVLFRRSGLMLPLPDPVKGGDVVPLNDFLNLELDSFDLLISKLVSDMVPDIPHCFAYLAGEQGSVKTSGTKAIGNVIDPSSVPLRSQPKDLEQWSITSLGSWVVPLDNLSHIPEWLSDALCTASTGAGTVKRKLYADDDLVASAARRVVNFNGIDVSGIKPDLGQRLIRFVCGVISTRERKEETALAADWDDAVAEIYGGLLDLLVGYLRAQETGSNKLDELPRMADAARVFRAVDMQRGTDTLSTYLQQEKTLAVDLAEEDPVMQPLRAFIMNQPEYAFKGAPQDLWAHLDNLAPNHRPRRWPANGSALTRRLNKLAPALRAQGWHYKADKADGVRYVHIVAVEQEVPGETGAKVVQLPRRRRGAGRRKRA